MEDVMKNQSHKRAASLWKRVIKDNARFKVVNKALTHEAKKKSSTKRIKNFDAQNDHLVKQNSEEHSYLNVCCRESIERPQKLVSVKDVHSDDDVENISTQSPENSRRNAICEVIEKQCIDHVCCDQEINLHQRRDCLRVEYALREVCLL